MNPCCYCGKPANIHRHDYVGDTRILCDDCNKKDEPGGLWCFFPEAKPPRKDHWTVPMCLQCVSPIPVAMTGNFCSEACETQHDREAYEVSS